MREKREQLLGKPKESLNEKGLDARHKLSEQGLNVKLKSVSRKLKLGSVRLKPRGKS